MILGNVEFVMEFQGEALKVSSFPSIASMLLRQLLFYSKLAFVAFYEEHVFVKCPYYRVLI